MLPGGSGRQVLLEVPGDGFSQFDRFDKAGLTEKHKQDRYGEHYGNPQPLIFSQSETIQGGKVTEMTFRGDLDSERIVIRNILN